MKSQIVDKVTYYQVLFYEKLNDFSQEGVYQKQGARVLSVFLAFVDVWIETMKPPLKALEHSGMMTLNLIGSVAIPIINYLTWLFLDIPALIPERCSTKDKIFNMQLALSEAANTPIAVLMIPIKLPYQIISGLWDPDRVTSIEFSGLKSHEWSQQPYFKLEDRSVRVQNPYYETDKDSTMPYSSGMIFV